MVKNSVVDLFSGIGGISIGFLQAGYDIKAAIEIDQKVAEIYKDITKVENVIEKDIIHIDASVIPDSEIITAAIPCGAFSKKADSYNEYSYWNCIIKIIECKKPKAFLFETNEIILRFTKAPLIPFVESLEQLGYDVKWKVLNSMEFTGWPISEKKIYIVGVNQREGVTEFIFPSTSYSETKNMYTILEQSNSIDDYYRKVLSKLEFSFNYGKFYVRQGLKIRNVKLLPFSYPKEPIVVDKIGPRYLTLGEIGVLKGFKEDIFIGYGHNLKKYLYVSSNVEVICALAKSIQAVFSEQVEQCIQETPKILNEWEILISIVDNSKSNSQEKGRALEQLLLKFFNTIEGFCCEANVRTETEEIDIEIYNKSNLFTDEKKIMICECKNWSNNVPRKELNVFIEKMKNRKGRCTVGFIVAWNGISDAFDKELLRFSREGELVVVLNKEGIIHAINESNAIDYLEKCYKEAIRK